MPPIASVTRKPARRRRGAALALGRCAAVAALAGCAHLGSSFPPDSAARPAPRAPERLLTAALAPPDPASPPVCRSPMVDPRDRVTRLVMVRSHGGLRADYEVPPGRYGVGPGELLRVDCASGEVIGIVPR